MEMSIALLGGLLLGGGLVAFVFSGRLREAAATLARREAELADLRAKESALAIRCATLQSELESERALFAERQATLEAARNSFADAFKALSADALAKNNQSFLELARATLEAQQAAALAAARGDLDKRQVAIGDLVAPVKTSLEKFEQQIVGLEKARVDAYATLSEQVRALATTILASLSWQGPVLVEMHEDAQGTLRLHNVIGRLWGSVQLAINAGFDVPVLCEGLVRGATPAVVRTAEPGHLWRWIVGDLEVMALRARKLVSRVDGASQLKARLRAFMDLFRVDELLDAEPDVWDAADPLPFVLEVEHRIEEARRQRRARALLTA